jgi:hypothetical protein
MKISGRIGITLVTVVATLFGIAGTSSVEAQGKSGAVGSGFSFDVYGDSRSMMYLPYKQ